MRFVFWRFGILAVVVSTLGLTTSTYAQVNGTGPSDAVLFDEVVNVSSVLTSIPEVPNGGTQQINLFEGGGASLNGNEGIEINVDGGSFSGNVNFGGEVNIVSGITGSSLTVNSGGQANILGGSLGGRVGTAIFPGALIANSGSDVNIRGGSVCTVFAKANSAVRISGGSFRRLMLDASIDDDLVGDVVFSGGEFVLNDNLIPAGNVEFAEGDVLTGTLEDGSAFSLGPFATSEFSPDGIFIGSTFFGPGNRVSLNTAPVPQANLAPIVVNTANPDIPSGLRVGQTLTLQEGGQLGRDFHAIRATLNIEGGNLGFDSSFGSVAVGSTVNISGGDVEGSLMALDETVVNVSGGTVGVLSLQDSQANISGGIVDLVAVFEGSEATINGGAVSFVGLSAGTTELVGGEFKLNGTVFDGATVTLGSSDELTGTFADGSTFIFNSERTALAADRVVEATLSRVMLPEIDTAPTVVAANSSGVFRGLRAGQELTLVEGGELGRAFGIVDATLNVEGGILGAFGEASRSEVNVSGGIVQAFFVAGAGSEVNISGGEMEQGLSALADSVVNISGGEVAQPFFANADSEVHLFGTEFFLNGVAINFEDGESITISERDLTPSFPASFSLSGTLLDGTSFEFELNGTKRGLVTTFSPDATLTVNLGSVEPLVLMGDVNLDGAFNFLDISPFITVLSTGKFQAEADFNEDEAVNFLDISAFIRLLVAM